MMREAIVYIINMRERPWKEKETVVTTTNPQVYFLGIENEVKDVIAIDAIDEEILVLRKDFKTLNPFTDEVDWSEAEL